MTPLRGLTDRVAATVGARARRRRFAMMLARFPDLPDMRVLDLGGELASWERAAVRPRELVLLNLGWQTYRSLEGQGDREWIRSVYGDACTPPQELAGERFDLVFSNSVIEHVGGHTRRIAFANTVHALGEHHWIQTPNRWFPIEPHAQLPALQFLPAGGRAAAIRRWPFGNMRTVAGYDTWPAPRHTQELHPDPGEGSPTAQRPQHDAMRGVLSIELLDAGELRFLFPASEIVRERMGGLTKSLIAVA